MVTVPLLAEIPSPLGKHTAWTNVPPYLEISETRAQIGYRQPNLLFSSIMFGFMGCSQLARTYSARSPFGASEGTSFRVNRVALTARCLLPVYPQERTSAKRAGEFVSCR
jgi:hypothetical protein